MTTTTFSPVKGAQAARAAIDLAVTYGYAAATQYAAGARRGRTAPRGEGASSTRTPPYSSPPAATSNRGGYDYPSRGWDCVATAEESGDWSFHGSNYSTALGIMNQAVRENTDPATAARIIAGQGTRAEQIAVAESIVRKHGFRRSWGVLTVQKCA